jgi:hypothetical protein
VEVKDFLARPGPFRSKDFWDYNEGRFPFAVKGLSKYQSVFDSGTSNVDVVRIFRTSTSPCKIFCHATGANSQSIASPLIVIVEDL